MHVVAAPRHVRKELAVVDVVCRCGDAVLRDGLLRPQAVVVVLERDARSGPAHPGQLTAVTPRVRPRAVIRQVADPVIG